MEAKAEAKKKKAKRSNSASSGRDSKGHFIKGNKVSVGNIGPSSEYAKQLKQVLLGQVKEKDIKAIVKKMIAQSKAGDDKARKELFDRLWGKAPQEVDLGDSAAKTLFDILAICGLNGGNGD